MSIITDQNGNVQFAPLVPQIQPMQQTPTSGLGLLAAQPGILNMFTNAMPTMPTMPEDSFDPRGALIGGGLMDLADIIMKRTPQNRGMDLYKNARTMYDRDRQLKYQNAMAKYQGEQQNFQNTLGVGQLMATLAKDTSPNDIKMMRYMGLDPEKPADQAKFYETVNKGKGTNISVDNSQSKGVTAGYESLFKSSADLLASYNQTSADSEEVLMLLDALEGVNLQIEGNGLLSNAADVVQGILNDTGVSFNISDETQWRDLYKSLSTKLALKELQAFKGPTTDFEYGKAESVNGALSATQAGRSLIIQTNIAQHMGKQAFADAYYQYGLAKMQKGEIPNMSDFKKTDQYREIAQQTVFATNPDIVEGYRDNMTQEQFADFTQMRARQLDRLVKRLYPDMSQRERDARAQLIFDQEFAGVYQ